MSLTDSLPAWFIAHGAPTHLMGQRPVKNFWQTLPAHAQREPRAILCLSAHWLTENPSFCGNSDDPRIQYDFYGFPDELYELDWPLTPDHNQAQWLKNELEIRIGDIESQDDRQLDHGVWVPLMSAWPEPPMPVYQLSLCPDRGALWHFELGQKLASLRQQGVLIIGSGGLVHNLRRINWNAKQGHSDQWAEQFMLQLEQAMADKDIEALCNPWGFIHGRECVPTIEHYLPLLVILGINDSRPLQPLFRDWDFGNLAMHSYLTSS